MVRPDAIIYKPDSSVRTIFLLTALFGEADAREQFRRLNARFASTLNCEAIAPRRATLLTRPSLTARTSSPLTTLRSLLHYVKDHVADHSSFSEALRSFLHPIELPALPNATAQYADKVETTAAFVDKLFGETMLEQLRCREAIARFMQVCSRQLDFPLVHCSHSLAHSACVGYLELSNTRRLSSILPLRARSRERSLPDWAPFSRTRKLCSGVSIVNESVLVAEH